VNARNNLQGLNHAQVRVFIGHRPEADERKRMGDVLRVEDDRAQAEAATLRTLTLMKQGPMPDLLTGRVRVPEEALAKRGAHYASGPSASTAAS
jgi:hypothetical protein